MNKRKLLWGLLATSLALVAAVGVVWSRSDIANLSASLENELALAAKAGMRSSPADIGRRLALAPQDNAAPHYQAAIALVKLHDKTFIPVTSRLDKRDVASIDWKDAALAIKAFEPAYKELLAGSKMPGMDFQRSWRLGFAMPLREIGDLHLCLKLIEVKALLASRNGHPDEALDALATGR